MNAAMKYTELRYQPEKSGIYVGSPSLLRLPDGALLASHDYFEADPVSNLAPRISEIYRSEDGGASWRNVNHLSGALWVPSSCMTTASTISELIGNTAAL